MDAHDKETVTPAQCGAPGSAASLRINSEEAVSTLFDASYELFWRPELIGERLQADLRAIRALGDLRVGTRILDLACGFGRIANALALDGCTVTGLDASAALLGSAQRDATEGRCAVRYILGDYRTFRDTVEHDIALLWFTSLGYSSEAADRAVLRSALENLGSGGRLMIETRHWDSIRRDFEPTTVRQSGRNLLIEEHRYVAETGVQWTRQLLLINGERVEREYGLRRYGFPELRRMCLDIGFSSVRGYDGHARPLRHDSQRSILVAVR